MPILQQTIMWLGIFAIALAVAAWMCFGGGFDWPVSIFAGLVTFVFLPFVIGWWRVVARRHGKVLPIAVDRPTTAASKDLTTFLQGSQSVPMDAVQILIDYSALHEDFPGCIIDTSWLPVSKENLMDVLKLSWLKADNDEARNWIETGWYLLKWFQGGVGQIPINVATKTPKIFPSNDGSIT